jgi:hypothetical protein
MRRLAFRPGQVVARVATVTDAVVAVSPRESPVAGVHASSGDPSLRPMRRPRPCIRERCGTACHSSFAGCIESARVTGQNGMRNLSHDPNIERQRQDGDVAETAGTTMAESASGSARWVAVRGRRLGVPRSTDPVGGLEVDTPGPTLAAPPVSTFGVSSVGDVSETGFPPGTDLVVHAPSPTEPSGHGTCTPATQQGSAKTCDTGVPMGARLLPVGTHALRIVMTNSNGRRRWAVDVLVRKRTTSTGTR